MDQTPISTMAKSALDILPIEITQSIMSAISDVPSLKSIALTSSSLYRVFIDAETLITSRVLLNELTLDVLPEATAALESSRLRLRTRERMQHFAAQHLQVRTPPLKAWTLSDAILMSKLYNHVQYFATDFASKALAKIPLATQSDSDNTQLSQNETTRIMRTFYRFEIFCNLFCGWEYRPFGLNEKRESYFSHFSPWENEQLACVHDYLFRVASLAFNDIAEHDVAWGVCHVEYGNRIDSEYIQHILSFGIAYLHRIALAETYDERYELLYSEYPPTRHDFLYEGLKIANEESDGVRLSNYTQKDEFAHITSPFAPDTDRGPANAWRWAHRDKTCSRFINVDSQMPLREWGYVMWDYTRLNESGIFQTPWEHPDMLALQGEEVRHTAEMNLSFEQRWRVSVMGGSGWWSFTDHSKISWANRMHSRDEHVWSEGEREHYEAKSLTDAREFLRSLRRI